MPKVSTNISLDADLKRASQELFADLGLDLSTAITLFLKQSLRVQGLPFALTRDVPGAETLPDEELLAISDALMQKNRAAYEVLAQ